MPHFRCNHTGALRTNCTICFDSSFFCITSQRHVFFFFFFFFLQLQKLWEHSYNNSHTAWFSRYLGSFILSCRITFGYQHAFYLLSISCYLTPWNDLTPSACSEICPLPAHRTACISLQRSRQFCHTYFFYWCSLQLKVSCVSIVSLGIMAWSSKLFLV